MNGDDLRCPGEPDSSLFQAVVENDVLPSGQLGKAAVALEQRARVRSSRVPGRKRQVRHPEAVKQEVLGNRDGAVVGRHQGRRHYLGAFEVAAYSRLRPAGPGDAVGSEEGDERGARGSDTGITGRPRVSEDIAVVEAHGCAVGRQSGADFELTLTGMRHDDLYTRPVREERRDGVPHRAVETVSEDDDGKLRRAGREGGRLSHLITLLLTSVRR